MKVGQFKSLKIAYLAEHSKKPVNSLDKPVLTGNRLISNVRL